jgi:hypothetical protein
LIALSFIVCSTRAQAQSGAGDPATAGSASATEVEQLQGKVNALTEQTQTMSADLDKLKKIKLSGYVQARCEINEASVDNASYGGTPAAAKTSNNNRFYIRRGRLKVTYESSPLAQGVVYVDGGQDRTVRLLEAYVLLRDPWTRSHSHALTMGQMNIPFGYEIERSSSVRELPERSRAENILFSGERDRGITLTSQWTPQLQTVFGVLNGGGINNSYYPNTDPSYNKDFVGRIRYVQGTMDGAVSYYNGRNTIPLTTASYPAGNYEHAKTRLGADAQFYYALPVIGGGTLRGEFYTGHDVNADSLKVLAKDQALVAGADPSHLATDFIGWYAMFVQNLGEKLQFAARYDSYDPNTDENHDQYDRVGVGLNYFYEGSTRITVAYDIPRTDVKQKAPSSGYKDPKDNLWTIQAQIKF